MVEEKNAQGKEYVVAAWHLDPKVTVGALLAAVIALVSSVSVVVTMGGDIEENRLLIQQERTLTNAQIEALNQRMDQTEERTTSMEDRLERDLGHLAAMIDKGFREVRNDIKYLLRNGQNDED